MESPPAGEGQSYSGLPLRHLAHHASFRVCRRFSDATFTLSVQGCHAGPHPIRKTLLPKHQLACHACLRVLPRRLHPRCCCIVYALRTLSGGVGGVFQHVSENPALLFDSPHCEHTTRFASSVRAFSSSLSIFLHALHVGSSFTFSAFTNSDGNFCWPQREHYAFKSSTTSAPPQMVSTVSLFFGIRRGCSQNHAIRSRGLENAAASDTWGISRPCDTR